MSAEFLTRRRFLAGSGSLTGLAALRGGLPGLAAVLQAACDARDSGAAFEVLTATEARELEAITARIVPTTDTPGAREAGVVYFIDRAAGGLFAEQLGFLRGGLSAFQAAVAAAHPGVERFSGLDETAQDAFLATQDRTDWFGFVHFQTMLGLFGLPGHGGNRDYVGWKLLGLDPHAHAHLPPFGHYDAEYRREDRGGD